MIHISAILKAKLLIVDDQAVNVLLLERLLSGAGYTDISSTQKPTEVMELHRQNRYDLILLDLNMPEMDGHQTGIPRSICSGPTMVLILALANMWTQFLYPTAPLVRRLCHFYQRETRP